MEQDTCLLVTIDISSYEAYTCTVCTVCKINESKIVFEQYCDFIVLRLFAVMTMTRRTSVSVV